MSDLDQFLLREIAFSGHFVVDEKGVAHAIVPLDLLQRVTKAFDVEHVCRELRGSPH